MKDSTGPDVAALKEKWGDAIYVTPIVLPDAIGGDSIDLYWRPPTAGNKRIYMDVWSKRGTEHAHRHLALNVIVHPDRHRITEIADKAPVAVSEFIVRGDVLAFLGEGAIIGPRRPSPLDGADFCNTMILPAEAGGDEMAIHWRTPTQGEYRKYMDAIRNRGPESANSALFEAIVQDPDRDGAFALCEQWPLAVSAFAMQSGVSHFFGESATVGATRKL